MKTKLSKRLLSVLLAVMMVVTSLPFVAITAYATTDLENLMEELDTMLSEDGAAYTNVEPAYLAYVEAQKAIDAYKYGGAAHSVVTTAFNNLEKAMDQMNHFTGYTGTAIPTFPNSGTGADAMGGFAGIGFNNVLYAPQATQVTAPDVVGNVYHHMYYSANAVLLYDGQNDVILPVMMSADIEVNANGYNKTRYIWSCYPSDSNGNDDANWYFEGQWNSGNGGDANWNWNWWSGTSNGVNSHAGYNKETGFLGIHSNNMRSGQLNKVTRSGAVWNYKYAGGGPLYMSNALKYKGIPADYNQEYYLTWYTTTGGDNNNDVSTATASAPIRVLNYKTLVDAIIKNGSKMKGVDLDQFSEGGLLEYIQAMDAATEFDPNTYFTSGDGYNACIAEMKKLVSDMENAPVENYDNESYENLRKAMDKKKSTYGDGTNNGYTDESWNNFTGIYEAAQKFMNDLRSTGYNNPTRAQDLADLLNGVQLETNSAKADTEKLEEIIDDFYDYSNIFTEETYNKVVEIINEAKIAVWTDVDLYKDAASGLDDTEENNAIIADYVAKIADAIRGLRISPDAYLTTSNGRFSLNSAIDLINKAGDLTQYWNGSDFATIVNKGREYVNKIAFDDFTDYQKQYDAYLDMIDAIVQAYLDLEYAFTKIPDGTLADVTSYTSIQQLHMKPNDSKYNYYADFTYPSKATVFRTTHNPLKVNYGDADFTYTVNNGSESNKENIGVDGITIAGTADAVAEFGSKSGAIGSNPNPPALSDDQRATYAANINYAGFSLANFRVTGSSNRDPKWGYGVTAAGATISTTTAPNDEFTQILGNVEANGSLNGLSRVRPQASGKAASITFTADMSYNIPGTLKQTLTANTVPTSNYLNPYKLSGTYFGVTHVWSSQPSAAAFSGYGYMTSKSNGEELLSEVAVVDISNLVELCDICDKIALEDSSKYTTASWSNFTKRLGEAKANMSYIDLTAAQILSECVKRYQNLWDAYQQLTIKGVNVTFNYKDAYGRDEQTIIEVQYGKTLNDYIAKFNAIVTPSYTSADGMYTYTFTGWSPEVVLSDEVTFEKTYTAQYDEKLNKADFTDYDLARAYILDMLDDYTYLAEDLKVLNEAFAEMTYFYMSDEEKNTKMGEEQPAIDAEVDLIVELITALTPVVYFSEEEGMDLSTYLATQEELAKAGKDPDAFDVSGVKLNAEETVNVAGEKDVIGLIYETRQELDAAIQSAKEAIKKCVYTVYMDGEPIGTAEFGTPVIANATGDKKLDVNVPDTTVNCDGDSYAWSYSYAAPSTKGVATAPKYMVTAPSFGFIVKGDTYLTTTKAAEESDKFVVTVIAKQNGNKIIDKMVVADGTTYTMPNDPSYVGYKFTGYSNGATPGQVITITADTTIYAEYVVNTTRSYDIDFYADDYSFAQSDPAPIQEVTAAYNQLVSFTTDDAFCWAKGYFDLDAEDVTYTIVHYGKDYSFYACETIGDREMQTLGLVALTYADFEAAVTDSTGYYTVVDTNGNPIEYKGNVYDGYQITVNPTVTALDELVEVYNNAGEITKYSMVGHYVLPEGYTMVECGFIYAADISVTDLKLDTIDNKTTYRFKASRNTVGNQFVINLVNNGVTTTFKYEPYAIVQNSDGKLMTIYGNDKKVTIN